MPSRKATLPFTILDQPAAAPEGTTLLNAIRTAGHPELLGCGCRLGDCGECRVALRYPGESALRHELTCVVEVVAGVVVCELPFPWTRAFRRDQRG